MNCKEKSRRREVLALAFSWSRFFCLLVIVFFVSRFLLASSSSQLFARDGFRHQELVGIWRNPAIEAVSEETSASSLRSTVTILQAVLFPDQIFVFLKYPPSVRLFTKDDLVCVYLTNSSGPPTAQPRPPPLTLPALFLDGDSPENQIVRCPLQPRGSIATLGLKSGSNDGPHLLSPGPVYRWNWLAYEAMIDSDNTTIVFIKGFNLRSDRLSDPTRFICVYGYDLTGLSNKFLLRSEVISIGQEIVRCKTPLGVLNGWPESRPTIKVSVRLKGRVTLPSAARPMTRPDLNPPGLGPEHEMCVCSMLRNQARFLKEWIMYHAHVGVQRWFLYDNNSDDNIEEVIDWLNYRNYNVSRHVWPWIKSQESGFAQCALRARGRCKWVGFIDVDEFLHLPSNITLHDVLRNNTDLGNIGEIRTSCYNFGPSGLKRAPSKGVTVGYTCRVAAQERHKSIIRPDALSPTLLNVVHHFRLKEGFKHVTCDEPLMVINHYKYQVWEVFKDKFYRRVATYVADWQDKENVGSRDRAPGLGTQPIEPSDWSARFCEVTDTRLRDQVLTIFGDGETKMLPWETNDV